MLADIPFLRPGSIDIGPLELQPFGILVALGVVLGAHLMRRWGETHDLDDDHIRSLVGWLVVCGFIGAHLFDVLAYQNDKLADDPILLLKIWAGISSYGGFIGGAFGFFYYVIRHKLPMGRYADVAIWGLTVAFTFGRLGCTLVHDHIGAYTEDFFLATNYTQEIITKYGFGNLEPGLHHNLGFYEFLYMLLLCGFMYGLSRWKSRPHGLLAAAVGTAYAPVRFFLDFLRVNRDADPRYFGLTFAQWMSLVLFAAGVYVIIRILQKPAILPEAVVVAQGADRPKSGKADRPQSTRSARAAKGNRPGKRKKS